MKKTFILLAILIIQSTSYSKEIWIYSDSGTWLSGIIAFEQFLNYIEVPHKRVYAKDLNYLDDYSEAKAICFPGGYAYDYKIRLNGKAINILRNYVASGGAYIGICAGAYFASSSVVWEGKEYKYPLSLFNGFATGSIHEIAPWDEYSMTKINVNLNNPIFENSDLNLNVLYYGGPFFESSETEFDILATWDEYNDYPAIINFNYYSGKVLLIGPHLEIGTNSLIDSTDFADELDDIESDWQLLETIINWVISSESGIERINEDLIEPNITPNPASDYIKINLDRLSSFSKPGKSKEIKIFNALGECVMSESIYSMTPSYRMNVSGLPAGLYFLNIGIFFKNIIVFR